jgi:hypothetical protein
LVVCLGLRIVLSCLYHVLSSTFAWVLCPGPCLFSVMQFRSTVAGVIIAMGRRKGDTDKGKRKARTDKGKTKPRIGSKAVNPNTQPSFCSSFNHQRGNVTATQRRFAAHFSHESTLEPSSVGVSTGLDANDCDGLSVIVNNSEGLPVGPPVWQNATEAPASPDDADHSDSDDEAYDPDAVDESEEDDDRRERSFCPDIEAALKDLFDMRARGKEIRTRLSKSHWLHQKCAPPGQWFNGKLKLPVRCCAPHLQYDDVVYTCVACNGTNTRLDGWTHGPRARLIYDMAQPYLLASYSYVCMNPDCGRKNMCSDARSPLHTLSSNLVFTFTHIRTLHPQGH